MSEGARPGGSGAEIRPVPEGYHTVTLWIISRDTARLLDFVRAAFGAEEIARVHNEDGTIGHAESRIGDSIVMAFDAKEEWPDTPSFLRLYAEDGDAAYWRALEAGATSVTEMTDLFFGDRVGRVRDPQGNLWWIQARAWRTWIPRRWRNTLHRRSTSTPCNESRSPSTASLAGRCRG